MVIDDLWLDLPLQPSNLWRLRLLLLLLLLLLTLWPSLSLLSLSFLPWNISLWQSRWSSSAPGAKWRMAGTLSTPQTLVLKLENSPMQ